MSSTTTTCDRCGRDLTAEETAKGWPVTCDDAVDLCPDCYGDEAYCPEGHLLPGHIDGPCPECARDEDDERHAE